MAALLMFAAGTGAQDQPNLDFANCKAQSDPDIAFQMDLCTAHAGCNLVVKAYKACTAVRSFTERLSNSIAQGVNTLFGSRSEVQPENIWEAVQTDNTRRVEALPEAKARSSAIREALAKSYREAPNERRIGTDFVTYGEVKGGDGPLQGWGTLIAADGTVFRGQFGESGLQGRGEWFAPTPNGRGGRATGEFIKGSLQGGGALVDESGKVEQGRFEAGALVEGKRTDANGASWQEGRFAPRGPLLEGSKYAADGSLTEKGSFRDGQLYVGERYANGRVVANVNRPREQMQQAEIAERTRREAAERTRQEAAAREQKLRDDQARIAVLATNTSRTPVSPTSSASGSGGDSCKQRADAVWSRSLARARSENSLYGAGVGGLFEHRMREMLIRMLEPCRGNRDVDDNIRAYREAIDWHKRRCAPGGASHNRPWCTAEFVSSGGAHTEAAARRFFAIFNEEYTAALNNSSTANSVAGAPAGVCKGGTWHDPAYEAALARIPRTDSVALIRGAIVGIDMQLRAHRSCPDASRDPVHIRALENQREAALRTCRQISARDNCLESPFR